MTPNDPNSCDGREHMSIEFRGFKASVKGVFAISAFLFTGVVVYVFQMLAT